MLKKSASAHSIRSDMPTDFDKQVVHLKKKSKYSDLITFANRKRNDTINKFIVNSAEISDN